MRRTSSRHRYGDEIYVGLFGRLGSGNTGNDGTLEAVLAYLRAEQPRARLDCMCSGPEVVRNRYLLPAIPLHWLRQQRPPPWPALALLWTGVLVLTGLVVDTRATAAWVRRHDTVIVPGMGTLEADLVERPWQMPYSLFLLSLFGRLYGTHVALVGVGATYIPGRANRFLMVTAAKLAHYRSFRDSYSRAEMQRMGLRARDEVYPDLVFSKPVPAAIRPSPRTIGVGVMAYAGANEDRHAAEELSATYRDTMSSFVSWLVESGYRVRLLIGDADDEPVAWQILASVRAEHPGLDPTALLFEPATTLDAVMEQVTTVEVVVAARYHNVVCALRHAIPTLAIAYGRKHDALMEQVGMAEMSMGIRDLDMDELIAQFTVLYRDRDRVSATLAQRHAELVHQVRRQFDDLSRILFSGLVPRPRRSIR